MANMKEYNRGRDQGLDMAWRLLRDAGCKEGAELVADEIRKRGKSPVKLAVTQKEIDKGLQAMKWCMYETFTCMSLMVLRDEFEFGKKRCLRFMRRWAFKTDCLNEGLCNWSDYVQAIRDELDIDVPTECMKEEGLI